MLALLQQVQHLARMPLLRPIATRSNDLQICLILSHKRYCEASEDSTEEHESDCNAEIEPEVGVVGGLWSVRIVTGDGDIAAEWGEGDCAGEREEEGFGEE